MKNNIPILFVEINDLNYIFVAGIYDENKKFKVVEKIITPNEEISKERLINIENASNIIKKNVELIENKLNYVFKDLTIIIENFDFTCVNISGFKKLNGSKVLKENISYILNSLKLTVMENEERKTILHIFNSKSTLDGVEVENLPIGSFGDFYSHELTFFLIKNNVIKNIKQIFTKNNLDISKVFLKSFSEGTELIKQNKIETFFKIKINKRTTNLSFFEHASFRYSENFNFGTNIIYEDISKICSIDNNFIQNYLSENIFENKISESDEFVDKKYFTVGNYRKIRKKLILDIAKARIEEIADIILNNNININFLKKDKINLFIIIQDELIKANFKESLIFNFSKKTNQKLSFINEFKTEDLVASTHKLISRGWKKEAVPITQSKTSFITRIFKVIFG